MKLQNEYVRSKQLLRLGIGMGTNVEKALAGISKKDFTAKMSIPSKEVREPKCWLSLIDRSLMVQIEVSKPLIKI